MNNKRTFNMIMLRLSAIVCGFSVLVFVIMLFQSNANKDTASATNYNSDQIIISVNNERIALGLPALIVNDQLMTAAQNKANHMAENGYFSHIGYGKKWSDFIYEAGYNYAEAGENLADGFDTVEEITAAWMNSPSHKDNIINTGVSETGVGVAYGKLDGYPTIFVAQDFGRKLIKDNQPAPVEQSQTQTQTKQQPATPPPSPEPQPVTKPKTLGELFDLPETVVGQ